uniref:PKD domain-containing protein n=1 Tax=Halorhabdus amylolytica TaxID=2559573 RepID=UPI00145BE1C6|nr:PKD domain-containing protein [Halorhabdus amylolytica]
MSIAITTVLIFGLIFAANTYLDDKRDVGARQQVESIGTGLAAQLEDAAHLGSDSEQVTLRVEQPAQVLSNPYTVSLEDGSECRLATSACLVVDVSRGGENLVREFPVQKSSNVDVSIERLDSTTFTLGAVRTGGATTQSDVVPIDHTLQMGVGSTVGQSGSAAISPLNRAPIPEFTFDPSFPDSSDSIEFDASASRDPDGTIVSYHWYIDGTNVSSGQIYDHTAGLSPGTHQVKLKVVDDEGGIGNKTRTISVSGLVYNDDIATTPSCTSGKCVEFTMENVWSETITISHVSIKADSSFNRIHYKTGSYDSTGPWGYDHPDPELRIDTDGDGSWDGTEEFNENDPLYLSGKEDGAIVPVDPIDVAPGETITVQLRGFRGGGNPVDSTIGVRYWVDDTSRRTIFTGS